MTGKQITRKYRLNQWAQIMCSRRESGLTVRAWCAENNINEKTYYYWQNKLREATSEQINNQESNKRGLISTEPCIRTASNSPMHPGWARISTLTTNMAAEETLTIEIGKSRIQANRNTTPELLTKVCRVLVSLC